jgi:hypothetical protein
MISYTALRKVVCSDAFRSVPTTDLYNMKLESIQKKRRGKKGYNKLNRVYKEISSFLPALIEALIDYYEVWFFLFHIALHTVP